MGIIRDILKRARGSMSPSESVPGTVPADTSGTNTSGTDTPAQPGRLRKFAVYIALVVIASVIGALSERYLGTRIEIPVPAPMKEQMQADAVPIDYEGCGFHGDVEHLHDVLPARWPTDRITYGIDYSSASKLNPPLSEDAIRAAFRQGAGWWTDGADLEIVEVPYSQALVPIRFERMDGPGGVLAEAYLADGTNRQKPMRFDSSERWTAGAPAANLVSLPTVFCHEFGHSLGLNHDAANAPAVMRPSYTSAIPREQPRDLERLFALGYRRRERVPPAPSDVLQISGTFKTSDVVDALKKIGYSVTGP